MSNIRGKTAKSRVNAAAPDASANAPSDSSANAAPARGGRAAANGQAQSISAKSVTPSAAKSAKIPPKPKWVSALSSPAPAERPRRSAYRTKPDSLDQWVNALPADPSEAPSIPSAAGPQTDKAEATKVARRKAPAAAALRKASAPPSKAQEQRAAAPPVDVAPASAPVLARPGPPPVAPTIGETPPLVAEALSIIQAPAASQERTALKAAPSSSQDAAAGRAPAAQYPFPDTEALARNIASAIEHAGRAFAAYLRPRETGEIKTTIADEIGEMVRSFGHVAEYYMSDPARTIEAQTALTTQFIDLWAATLQRFQGGSAKPIAEPDRSDKRFSDAEWRENPFFDFIKQAYVLTTRWADDLVSRADDLEPHERHKAQFYLRQVTAALAPSNFIGTNPELIRATLAESGENLARGLKMLAEDIEAGKGNLRIRQSDARAFKLGVNMATTPGKVIFRNELIELIQYAPTTPEVYRRPLLIVPPWINKFYILDLNSEKSFIRWAVSQGLTVFVISWVNPNSRHADRDFDAYMHEGVLTALDCVEQATGERQVAAIGYCVGGTLLAATLGYLAAVGDKRINSVTFFTALVDFTDAGDLQVFVDAAQLKAVEERMAEQGFLEGSAMASAFNMLRPNDLIWSYYVNNYLKGKEPMPFDLLVWNSDSTRMPAANHSFYLRHCYLQNDLSNRRMRLSGKTIDLGKVTIPIYELATKEDHIAPARGVFKGAKCFGGPVRFVLAGSGHIAGVVNPAGKPKYQFWTGGPIDGDFDSWLAAAKETPGSWWPDWIQWTAAQAPDKVPARIPGEGALKAIGDAPGEYVRMKA
jgi:polyhydroxyalkanoate synthase subunit PhaC